MMEFLPFERMIYRSVLPQHSEGAVVAIVAQYLRPYNIDLIARALLLTPSVQRVIICENNPECRLDSWLPLRHPRLHVVRAEERAGTPDRYRIARSQHAEKFLIVDDDLFLQPRQMEVLCRRLDADPEVPHGIVGQRQQADGSFDYSISGVEGELDILNRVYACTAEQVCRTIALLEDLHVPVHTEPWGDFPFDDIALSFSGARRPMCHDVGAFLDCPTQGTAGIAAWREGTFSSLRQEVYSRLSAMRDVAYPCPPHAHE